MGDDWNWNTELGKQSTVVKSVKALAVYTNEDGDIVIRQEGYGSEDEYVVIPRKSVNDVIKAIRAELKA